VFFYYLNTLTRLNFEGVYRNKYRINIKKHYINTKPLPTVIPSHLQKISSYDFWVDLKMKINKDS